MTSPAKDHAPTRAYYFKPKIMTYEIQNSQLACLITRHHEAIGEHLPLLSRCCRGCDHQGRARPADSLSLICEIAPQDRAPREDLDEVWNVDAHAGGATEAEEADHDITRTSEQPSAASVGARKRSSALPRLASNRGPPVMMVDRRKNQVSEPRQNHFSKGEKNQWVVGRGSWIRTNDLQYPKLPRYQAALYPDFPREEVDTRSERSQQGTAISLDRAATASKERCNFKRLA